jgi:parallel beta-helix repeat protein
MKTIFFALLFLPLAWAQETISLKASDNLWAELQDAITTARPNTTIELPEGNFSFKNEIIVNVPYITLRGKGHKKTVLSFKHQKIGAQGILATEDAFTLENLAIEDTKGDGLKVEKANHVTIRGVRIEWTNGPDEKNGAYGFYPVQTSNTLIEDCIVIGASDAGIYVGQSKNIVVRRNYVFQNVAGIEIENSTYADVYDNHTLDNTAGILVFDLPNLKVRGGKKTRVFRNKIESNNYRNFAPPGNIVGHVPAGTGIMIIANDDVEIFENEITNHHLAAIILANYLVTGYKVNDKFYDPKPDKINIHDNTITRPKDFSLKKIFETEMHFLINYHSNLQVADILWDGVQDGTYSGEFKEENKICIKNNRVGDKDATFANLHLDSDETSLFGMLPGGPLTNDINNHNCSHAPLAKIEIKDAPIYVETEKRLSKKEVNSLCSIESNEINWKAVEADCPKLSDYNLFIDAKDATKDPNGGNSHYYELSTPLFTDYALKHRFIFLPNGESIDYNANRTFTFPEGTIISKTFSYPEDFDKRNKITPIETRLLLKRKNGWKALSYIWDHEKGEAFLSRVGKETKVKFKLDGKEVELDYSVPSQNQCFSCHGIAGKLKPIGPQAKLLNYDVVYADGKKRNQLEYLRELRVLTGLHLVNKAPKAPNYLDTKEPLELRAKAYLHSNCAHCHSPMGRAKTSGLFLEYERDHTQVEYGNCKPPVAAGRGAGELKYIIQPGNADHSILIHRMNSNDPGSMMPEIGRGMVHKEGLKLVKDYINKKERRDCE